MRARSPAIPVFFDRPRVEHTSFAFVLCVWLAALIATHVFIATYAARTPIADDVTMFVVVGQPRGLWEWLWALHNEHRLPLPKLVQYALYLASGDIRSGMHAEAAILGATALACVLVARKLRGARPWDAIFPLMWLQLGNAENLLMGFCLQNTIPMACVCALFFASVLSPARLAPSRAIVSGLALVALPLCGGAGLLCCPALAAWIAWLGWRVRRSANARERRSARIHFTAAALTLGIVAAYFVGFHGQAEAPRELDPRALVRSAIAVTALAFGPGCERVWPASGWLVAAFIAAIVLAIGSRALRTRAREPVALGTIAVFVSAACLALGLAYARPLSPPGLPHRYVPFFAPFFTVSTLGSLALFNSSARELPLVACFFAMIAATPASIEFGTNRGRVRREMEANLDRLVRSEADAETLSAYFNEYFSLRGRGSWWPLDDFAVHRLPPFDRARAGYPDWFESPLLDIAPIEIDGNEPPVERMLEGEKVYCVAEGTRVSFACASSSSTFGCRWGVPGPVLDRGNFAGIRMRVRLREDDGRERELGDVASDPARTMVASGMRAVDLSWEPGSSRVLTLIVEPPDGTTPEHVPGWIKLRGVYIR
jgi:hypothetical protein